jgi:hypothetical protein
VADHALLQGRPEIVGLREEVSEPVGADPASDLRQAWHLLQVGDLLLVAGHQPFAVLSVDFLVLTAIGLQPLEEDVAACAVQGPCRGWEILDLVASVALVLEEHRSPLLLCLPLLFRRPLHL